MQTATKLLIFAILTALSVNPARAQETPAPTMRDPVPVEIALAYDKLLKIQPDFVQLMELNPTFKEDSTRFGNEALRKQQYEALKKIYDDFGADSVFMVKKRLRLTALDGEKKTVALEGLTPDEPFVFDLTDHDRYGIFLRNVDEALTFGPPYAYEDLFSISGYSGNDSVTFPAEIVVKPVAADTKPFPTEKGDVKPIIADIVEITVLNPDGKRVGVTKRFNDWQPASAGKPSLLDLKDNPLKDAIPAPTQ